MRTHSITMLGTGLIGDFYTMTLHGQRGRDRVRVVYSRTEDASGRRERGDPVHRQTRRRHTGPDVVVVGRRTTSRGGGGSPAAGKAVLCTKALGATPMRRPASLTSRKPASSVAL